VAAAAADHREPLAESGGCGLEAEAELSKALGMRTTSRTESHGIDESVPVHPIPIVRDRQDQFPGEVRRNPDIDHGCVGRDRVVDDVRDGSIEVVPRVA
jgi:hypothetical protein